jgi:CRP-like cAMP-binding protein
MTDLLTLAAHLPTVHYRPGDTVLTEGEPSGGLWVLVSGALEVRKGAVVVNSIDKPGASVGEMSLLLKTSYSATVRAVADTEMRYAADGAAFLVSHPDLILRVATELAARLSTITTYLADLKQQYGEAPGLAMVNDVLRELASRPPPAARPGSMRDPDPEY